MKTAAKIFPMKSSICGPIAICIAALLYCTPPPQAVKPQGSQKINIQHEKLIILPFTGLETFARMSGWPSDSGEIAALVSMLAPLYDDLVAEFRRCEKFGMYTVVDSLHGPTVVVQPQFAFEAVRNDSLFIRVILNIENKATEKKASIEIRAWGLFDPSMRNARPLNRIGLALASYRRLFPYKKAVAFFYPDGAGKNDGT